MRPTESSDPSTLLRMTPPRPPYTLFPYTTLFRSLCALDVLGDRGVPIMQEDDRISRRRVVAPEVGHIRLHAESREIERDRIQDRKSTRLNSSHLVSSYAVFCLKKKKTKTPQPHHATH